MAFCENCGTQLLEAAAFCANCGKPSGESTMSGGRAENTRASADQDSSSAGPAVESHFGRTPTFESSLPIARIVGGVTLIVILALAYFLSAGSAVLLFLLPILVGAVLPVLSLDPVTNKVESLELWIQRRRDKVRGKEGKFARFFSRPLYAGCLWIYRITEKIREPHLRAGARIATLLYFVWIMIALLMTVVYVVVALVFVALIFWLISAIWGSSDRGRSSTGGMAWSRIKTSRVREGVVGDNYVEHYDEKGHKVAETRKQDGFLGLDPHLEHVDASGKKIGESREDEGFLGLDPHTVHVDAGGMKVGETREKDGLLGLDPHDSHTDTDGKEVATSRRQNGFLGFDPHTEHSQNKD